MQSNNNTEKKKNIVIGVGRFIMGGGANIRVGVNRPSEAQESATQTFHEENMGGFFFFGGGGEEQRICWPPPSKLFGGCSPAPVPTPVIVIHYTTLHYTTLWLWYTSLHYTALHYSLLHYTILHYSLLHYTILHYSLLHHSTSRLTHFTKLQYYTISTLQSTTKYNTTLHYDHSTL